MIKEIMYKIFGVEPSACPVCEVLREQLYKSDAERMQLLQRALAPPSIDIPVIDKEEQIPIKPQYMPWRVRQQMLEQEDHKKAELMRAKATEIAELEKELGVVSG